MFYYSSQVIIFVFVQFSFICKVFLMAEGPRQQFHDYGYRQSKNDAVQTTMSDRVPVKILTKQDVEPTLIQKLRKIR